MGRGGWGGGVEPGGRTRGRPPTFPPPPPRFLQRLVDTAMLAAVGGLAYALGSVLRLQAYMGWAEGGDCWEEKRKLRYICVSYPFLTPLPNTPPPPATSCPCPLSSRAGAGGRAPGSGAARRPGCWFWVSRGEKGVCEAAPAPPPLPPFPFASSAERSGLCAVLQELPRRWRQRQRRPRAHSLLSFSVRPGPAATGAAVNDSTLPSDNPKKRERPRRRKPRTAKMEWSPPPPLDSKPARPGRQVGQVGRPHNLHAVDVQDALAGRHELEVD